MALSNPVLVYNAENNVEVHLVCQYLEQQGIEAHAVIDDSVVGLWAFGVLPEIHKPQVWVDKSESEKAKLLLKEYESWRRNRTQDSEDREPIEVLCEECGKTSTFSASMRGTVQDCPHCGAYVDVGDDELDSSDSS